MWKQFVLGIDNALVVIEMICSLCAKCSIGGTIRFILFRIGNKNT